jgi:O-antigen ligase
LAFLLPFLSLITVFGVSLVSYLFLISSLILIKPCRDALIRHWPQVRWVVLAFLLHFLFVLACKLGRGANWNTVEKPSRMFFAFTALPLVLAFRPARRALWWGVTAGAVLALGFVAWQRLWLHIDRPGGLINSITYGDLCVMLALLALAGAIDLRREPRQARIAAIGALAGLAASVLTGTRGGWVALLPAAVVLARHMRTLDSRRVRALLAVAVLLLGGSWFVPALGVQARFEEGVSDVRTWIDGGNVFTRMGTRLELWKGAIMLVKERPLLGRDFLDARARLAGFAQEGKLDPVVLPLPHLHNDGLQELATGGVVGFVLWAAMMGTPLVFFGRNLGRDARAPQFAAALAGLLVVLGYLSFGLTEVIFWSVTGSLFFALMVFLLMGLCLNAKENIG